MVIARSRTHPARNVWTKKSALRPNSHKEGVLIVLSVHPELPAIDRCCICSNMHVHLEQRRAFAFYCLKLYPCNLRLEQVDVPKLMKKTGEQLPDLTRIQQTKQTYSWSMVIAKIQTHQAEMSGPRNQL